MKICSKCQQKNPNKVEVHDLASGKMVWEVLTKCMKCNHTLADAIPFTNEQKRCPSCGRKNPSLVEIQDLASGKMVWEVLTKCMYCSHSLEQKKEASGLSELDRIAQKLFKEEFAEEVLAPPPVKLKKDVSAVARSSEPERFSGDPLAQLRPLWDKLAVAKTKEDIITLLQKVERSANTLIHQLEEVDLAWSRGTHSLFVECPNTAVAARHIVKSLNVDGATARMLAASKLPKIALYEKSPINAKHFAKRYQQLLQRQALPIKREMLEKIPNAHPCIRVMPEGFWVGSGPLWSRPNLYGGSSIHLRTDKIEMVVSGEVEVQYYREIRRRKETEWKKNRTERYSVIDLHSNQGIIRLCNTYTDLSVMPNIQSLASNINFKLYREGLTDQFPFAIFIEGYRAFPPELGLGSSPTQDTMVSGWPQWEAYTRACRLLYGV